MRPIRVPRPDRGLDLAGAGVATVLLCLSFTPSLLPRGWVLQGVLGGLCAATGYALGCLPGVVLRRGRRAGRRTGAVLVVLAVPAAYQGWRWQQELCQAVGVDGPPGATWPGVLPVAAVVFAALLGAARLLRRRAAVPLLAVLVLAGGPVAPAGALGSLSAALDGRVTGVAAPADPARSGSADSLVPWASLGRQGRVFVTGALPARHATAPIRVYAGLGSAPSTRARARLAVAELERTGAFGREVLCLVVPTGSGWIDEPTVAALEDEFGGDTAVAAVQYAALPSWLSLATGPDRAEAAAADLLAEVRRAWSARPAADRPKLLLYGHSLGALAAQAPFGTAESLLGTVDGALISGAPAAGRLRTGPGHTRPDVRVAAGPADLVPADPAAHPRVVFLQHATDPVVWWSPRLLVQPPDRLPGRWWPVVTFWQVSADLLTALDVPAGHGHRYGAEARAAWHLIAGTGPGEPAGPVGPAAGQPDGSGAVLAVRPGARSR